MLEKQGNNFFVLYDLGLKRKRWNCVTLSQEMLDEGVRISPRSLQRYRTGEMKPSFEMAKAIFKALDVEATDDQIKKSLLMAGDERGRKKRSPYIERGIRIRIKKLSSDPSEDDPSILLRLQERISDTQGKIHGNFNQYITQLIRYDLENNVLPAFDENGSDKGED